MDRRPNATAGGGFGSLDVNRVEGFLGRLSQAEFAPLGARLCNLFGPAMEPQEP